MSAVLETVEAQSRELFPKGKVNPSESNARGQDPYAADVDVRILLG